MSKCIVSTSFRFGNAQLCVSDTGIHYHYLFTGGAVVFNLIYQLPKFAV